MTFREVETLFHEAGHALQHMLTEQSEGLVAGIRGVEWDAVELPSQFMENWWAAAAAVGGAGCRGVRVCGRNAVQSPGPGWAAVDPGLAAGVPAKKPRVLTTPASPPRAGATTRPR